MAEQDLQETTSEGDKINYVTQLVLKFDSLKSKGTAQMLYPSLLLVLLLPSIISCFVFLVLLLIRLPEISSKLLGTSIGRLCLVLSFAVIGFSWVSKIELLLIICNAYSLLVRFDFLFVSVLISFNLASLALLVLLTPKLRKRFGHSISKPISAGGFVLMPLVWFIYFGFFIMHFTKFGPAVTLGS